MWLGTLLGLLLHWIVTTRYSRYVSMSEGQSVAYISDVGASELKPLFIAGCVVTTVFLDLGFAADRWLRHRGRLVPNTTTGEKVLSGLTIFFAVIGTIGLILLSVFDTVNHDQLHSIFLLFFIAGYCFSAIFICWEYQRLGISESLLSELERNQELTPCDRKPRASHPTHFLLDQAGLRLRHIAPGRRVRGHNLDGAL